MPRPSVDEFRSVPAIVKALPSLRVNLIAAAIDSAFYTCGVRCCKEATIFAAAHLLSLETDDATIISGDISRAVDLGTGGALQKDLTDGDRRVISSLGAGTAPGVPSGSDWDIFWSLTPFGRRALEIERRASARRPLRVA
jgi:hypothetical protein